MLRHLKRDMAEITPEQHERIQGLMEQHSLPASTVLDIVLDGADLALAVERHADQGKAWQWVADQGNRAAKLNPLWDFNSERFYLAMDGALPGAFVEHYGDVTILMAERDELIGALCYASGRDLDVWHDRHRSKSACIAYRWSTGRAVTPPMVTVREDGLLIEGGCHRVHLAAHYKAAQIPILVRVGDVSDVVKIVPSAKRLSGAGDSSASATT